MPALKEQEYTGEVIICVCVACYGNGSLNVVDGWSKIARSLFRDGARTTEYNTVVTFVSLQLQ